MANGDSYNVGIVEAIGRKKIWWMEVVRVPPARGAMRHAAALSAARLALAGSATACAVMTRLPLAASLRPLFGRPRD